MKRNPLPLVYWAAFSALLLLSSPDGGTQLTGSAAATVRTKLPGPLLFPDEPFLRITGKAVVLDAHRLRLTDGTEIDLNGMIDAPDLDQNSLMEGTLFRAGREAAAFLRKLVAESEVICITAHSEKADKPGGYLRGQCFIGETNLQIELVRNGWAIAHHSAMEPWEAIARYNQRGLWRGKFVAPEKWRKGERLVGE